MPVPTKNSSPADQSCNSLPTTSSTTLPISTEFDAHRSTDQLSNLSANRSSTQLLRSKGHKKNDSVNQSGDTTWKRGGESAGRRRVKTRPPFAVNEPETPPETHPSLPNVFVFPPAGSSHSHFNTSTSTSTTLHNEPSPASSLDFTSPRVDISPKANVRDRQEVPPLFDFPPPGFPAPPPLRSSFDGSTFGNALGLIGKRRNTVADLGSGKTLRPTSLGGEPEGFGEFSAPPTKGAGTDRGEWWPFGYNAARTRSHTRRAMGFGGGGEKSYFPEEIGEGGLGPGYITPHNRSPRNSTVLGEEIGGGGERVDQRHSLTPSFPSPVATGPLKAHKTSKPSFRIDLPTPHPFSHSAHHSKTPGWSSPYSAPQRLRRLSATELESGGSRGSTKKGWVERAQNYVLHNTWVPLVIRLVNFSFTICTLGLGIKIRSLEGAVHLMGVIGSSPLVAIIYSPITLIHVIAAVYVEYFGPPLGLWSLPSKILFTSLDLIIISLWSSLLSLVLSDLFTSPLYCVPVKMRWWTHVVVAEDRVDAPGVCSHQIGLVVMVFVGVVGFLLGNVVSLGRIFAKVVKRSGYR